MFIIKIDPLKVKENYLFLVVKLNHSVATIFDVVFLHPEDLKPRRVLRQRFLQLTRSQVYAGHRNRLWHVADKNVGAQAVVHEIPVGIKIAEIGGMRRN